VLAGCAVLGKKGAKTMNSYQRLYQTSYRCRGVNHHGTQWVLKESAVEAEGGKLRCPVCHTQLKLGPQGTVLNKGK